MKKILLVIIFSICLVFSNFTYGFATLNDFEFFAKLQDYKLTSGDYLKIVGNVKDESGNPIEAAKVEAILPSGTISEITNDKGEFLIKSQKPLKPGHYMSSIIVTVEERGIKFASLTYDVKEKSAPVKPDNLEPKIDNEIKNTLETIPGAIETIPSAIEEGVTKNPISDLIMRQIQEMEKQKQQHEQRLKEINKEANKHVDEQRKLAKQFLDQDLERLEKKHEEYTPRNAFARFVADVDKSVRALFWGQFELTERISNEAHDAKIDALEEGKTPAEAMKIFQRKAGITNKELVDYNKELNIKYGFADQNSQDSFNEFGTIRNSTN